MEGLPEQSVRINHLEKELAAKNRALEVEVALEQVRARTMTMLHSDELMEAANLLFQQVHALGIPVWTCGFNIWALEEKTCTGWMSTNGVIQPSFRIPLTESPVFQHMYDSRINGEESFTEEIRGEELTEHYRFMFSLPDFKAIATEQLSDGFSLPTSQVHHVFNFKQGNLIFIAASPLPEYGEIFRRFTKVFEQTYIRFLDLQKAEAQAREAQIEIAMERVRSRSLAMHTSEELREVAIVLYTELKKLGFQNGSGAIVIMDAASGDLDSWVEGSADGYQFLESYHVPFSNHETHLAQLEHWKKGKMYATFTVSGEAKKRLDKYYFSETDFVRVPEATKSIMMEQETVVFSMAFMRYGAVSWQPSPISDEQAKVLQRFSKVFEQSYTRFLDLQKAESQSREAQIELALERVRARTMAIQKSEDLREVVMVLYAQLANLGFQWGAATITIMDSVTGDMDWWLEGFGDGYDFPESYHVPFFNHTGHKQQLENWKNGSTYSVVEISGIEKKSYDDYYFNQTDFIRVPENTKQLMKQQEAVLFSMAYMKYGALSWSPTPLSDVQSKILQRFAKVFEQTYTRFLDLQKAEGQAREAQIEAALEKVRSSSLAMHHSGDLKDIIAVLFEKLIELNVLLGTVAIQLFDQKSKNIYFWVGNTIQKPQLVFMPYDEQMMQEETYLKDGWDAMLAGEDIINREYTVAQKNKYFDYVFAHNDFTQIPESARAVLRQMRNHIICLIVQKNSALFADSWNGQLYSNESLNVIKRAGKVFEQAYIRFLDLQKAEAQAREAEIALALERVRGRTMSMQQSTELADVAALLFQQVRNLGIEAWTTGFNVWMKNDTAYQDFVTNPQGGFIEPYTVDLTEFPPFIEIREAKQRGDDFFVRFESGEQIKETYQHLLKYAPEQYGKLLDDGFQFPSQQFEHFVFGKTVSFMFITYEPVPEAHDIFKRFGKAFEQTYTRFLDLQKAEEQAREAQIEVALEKVRSTSLAMHKAEELTNIVGVVFQKLKELGLTFDVAGIQLYAEGSKDIVQWVAAPDLLAAPIQAYLPFVEKDLLESEILKDVWQAKEMGKSIFNKNYSFDEKNKFFEYAGRYNDFTAMPEDVRAFQLNAPGYTQTLVAEKRSALWVDSYSGQNVSSDGVDILLRFGRVFEQAYVRFLDLQKAEGQAREAQIEAALERVRSRSMGMQRGTDLKIVVKELYDQLRLLGFEWGAASITIMDAVSGDIDWWMEGFEDGYDLPEKYHVPYFDNKGHNLQLDHWKNGSNYAVIEITGLEKKVYDAYYFSQTDFAKAPENSKRLMMSQDAVIFSMAYMKYGALSWAPSKLNEHQATVLQRMAKVFEQTYTRFLDLQKAEAQAIEAIKRASVDRIRAEIASMRTTRDLERITPLIWNELTTLGVPFVRCGVFIMDEEKQEVQSYLSTPEGNAIAAFRQPFNTPGEISDMVASWYKKELYRQHWNEEKFIEFTQKLVDQRAITSGEKYLTENRPSDLYLHFVPFLQGMLYVGSIASLTENELQLVQNLADAFSTAYARYEDFNRLEAAKEVVDKTLTDLKQTQAKLVQSEKMASLGELTAGIAHEIQNPLNFVNNFSELNKELLAELNREIEEGNFEEVKMIALDVTGNEEKISHHGRRAEAIVKGMLQHSRSGVSEKEPTDINRITDEYFRLAFHGLRGKDKSFNAILETGYDENLPKADVVPQDIGRVLLNIFNNAFYAVNERKKESGKTEPTVVVSAYEPRVLVTTKKSGNGIVITVTDNGNGIPENIIEKIFQPFFTTKPTGQGTGLGLSLAYDIITKGHGGELKVNSVAGEGTALIITLPLTQ